MIYLHWKIKYLPKLAHNTFPTYFNSYRHFFVKKILFTVYAIIPRAKKITMTM